MMIFLARQRVPKNFMTILSVKNNFHEEEMLRISEMTNVERERKFMFKNKKVKSGIRR